MDADLSPTPAPTSTANAAPATAQDCTACARIAAKGWWGNISPARSHCTRCHRYWASYSEAHCSACCRHFANHKAADAHHRADHCLDPATVTRRDGQPRFTTRETRYGLTWRLAFYGQHPERWGQAAPESGDPGETDDRS